MIKKVLHVDIHAKWVHNNPGDITINSVETSYMQMISTASGKMLSSTDIINKVKKISEKSVEKDSKVYFAKNCAIPRVKIKSYCEENNLKVIRDMDKSDYIVYSDDSFHRNINYGWFHVLPTEEFINFLKAAIEKNLFTQEYLDNIIEALNQAEYKDKITYDYGTARFIAHITKEITGKNYTSNSKRLDYITDENMAKIIKDPDSYKFIHQDYILSKLNVDNILTEESYNSIRSLLDSNDESNLCVGMEIMANSDYDNSALYLLLLLKEFRQKLYYSKYKNHVNFKSLLQYFSVNLNHSYDWDFIILTLKNKKLMTKENHEYIERRYMDDVYDYFNNSRRFDYVGIQPNSFFFNVKIDE